MRFFAQILISLIVVAAVWSGANLFRKGEPLENNVNNSCQMIEHKRFIANRTPRPKLVVIGASNVMFGIRSERITAGTGLPTINLGLAASVGVDVIFATARSVLQPGDIAVLTIEHFLYTDLSVDGPFIRRAMFQCQTDALSHLPWRDRFKTFLLQPLSDVGIGVVQSVARRLDLPQPFKVPDHRLPESRGFSPQGDFLDNRTERRTAAMQEFVRTRPGGTTLPFSPNSAGVRAVSDFAAWARRNDVTVLASWPAVYWPRRDLAVPGLQKIRELYESLGLPILGEPTDTMLPLDNYFDTNNHLTAEAAETRSDRLAERVDAYLRQHPAVRPSH